MPSRTTATCCCATWRLPAPEHRSPAAGAGRRTPGGSVTDRPATVDNGAAASPGPTRPRDGAAATARGRLGRGALGSGGVGLGRRALGQEGDLPGEIGHVLETLVDGGEADRRHGIELLQAFENRTTQALARDLAAGRSPDLVLHGRDQRLDLAGPDLASLDRRPDPGHDLLPVEGLTRTRPFDHDQRRRLEPLEGGKTVPALEALAPPSDRGTVLRLSGVDDLGVDVAAGGAPHGRETIGRGEGIDPPTGAGRAAQPRSMTSRSPACRASPPLAARSRSTIGRGSSPGPPRRRSTRTCRPAAPRRPR